MMDAAIEKYTNQIDKDVIREAILTKAIVEYPNEYDQLRGSSIEKWLFGAHETLYHLLNRISWGGKPHTRKELYQVFGC